MISERPASASAWLRPAARTRTTVEECVPLDLAHLSRLGVLRAGTEATVDLTWHDAEGDPEFAARVRTRCTPEPQPGVRITYADPTTGRVISDGFRLVTTAPYFGGLRWWAECRCGRRCRVVYLAPDGRDGFRCRACHGLAYRSQRLTPRRRLYQRAGKLCARIGCAHAYDPDPAQKPKWMRWRTYDRVQDRARALSLTALCASLGPGEVDALELAPHCVPARRKPRQAPTRQRCADARATGRSRAALPQLVR